MVTALDTAMKRMDAFNQEKVSRSCCQWPVLAPSSQACVDTVPIIGCKWCWSFSLLRPDVPQAQLFPNQAVQLPMSPVRHVTEATVKPGGAYSSYALQDCFARPSLHTEKSYYKPGSVALTGKAWPETRLSPRCGPQGPWLASPSPLAAEYGYCIAYLTRIPLLPSSRDSGFWGNWGLLLQKSLELPVWMLFNSSFGR